MGFGLKHRGVRGVRCPRCSIERQFAMVIESSELKRDFLFLDDSTTVGQLRDRLLVCGDLWIYVAVALAGGGFAVLRLSELIEALKASDRTFRTEVLARRLGDIPTLLAARGANSVEEAGLSPARIRALFRDGPRGRWVVLKDG